MVALTLPSQVNVTSVPGGGDDALAANWWRDGWGDGATVEPGFGRPWNVGQMANSGQPVRTVDNYLKKNTSSTAHCAVTGGKCYDFGAEEVSTWNRYMGGPEGDADNVWNADFAMTNLRQHGHVKEWALRTNGYLLRHWGYMGIPPVPLGMPGSIIQEVIDGTHDSKIKKAGARLKASVVDCGCDADHLIIRLGYEFNQKTACRFSNGPGIFQVFNNQGLTRAQALTQFKAFFGRVILKLREGYGSRLIMALSPALDDTTVPYSFFNIGEYWSDDWDLLCGSFHPNPDRATSATAGRALVSSTTSQRHTAARMLQAHLSIPSRPPMCFLEHHVYFGENANDPRRNMDLTGAIAAYDEMGKFLNGEKDTATPPAWDYSATKGKVAFTCLLNDYMCVPSTPWGDGNPPFSSLSAKYKEYFGEV